MAIIHENVRTASTTELSMVRERQNWCPKYDATGRIVRHGRSIILLEHTAAGSRCSQTVDNIKLLTFHWFGRSLY